MGLHDAYQLLFVGVCCDVEQQLLAAAAAAAVATNTFDKELLPLQQLPGPLGKMVSITRP